MKLVCDWNSQGTAAVLVLFATLIPGVAAAEVVTLQDLEELALQNQKRWEAVEASSAQAGAEIDVARAGMKPTFLMNVGVEAAPGSFVEQVRTTDGRVVNVKASPTVTQREGFRPNARYETTLAMRAPLYDGRVKAAIKAAEAYQLSAQASSHASRHAVLIVVRASYLDWMDRYLVHKLANTAAEEAKTQRERVEARVAEGDRPGSELDIARYEELQAELVEADARANAVTAERVLEAAVGSELPAEAEPDTRLLEIDAGEPDTSESWDLQVLEYQGAAARYEAIMHRKIRSPVLAALAQTGFAGINERVFPMYRLGLELAVPLGDGGRAAAMARAASAQADELDARARDARSAKDNDREHALLDRKHAEEQLEIADSLVSISEKRVEQAQASYELGASDLESVAEVRAALRDARSRRVQIQVARVDAILRMEGDDSVAHRVLDP